MYWDMRTISTHPCWFMSSNTHKEQVLAPLVSCAEMVTTEVDQGFGQ